jgi:hypothetical protein
MAKLHSLNGQPAKNSGTMTITPGSPSDQVKVTLSVLGEKVFVRLRVAQ